MKLFRRSIALKIGFLIGLSCLAVSLAGLVWMLLLLRADIVEHSRRSMDAVTDAIQTGFRAFDKERDSHPLSEMLEDLSVRDEILRLRIFDSTGKIIWSKDADEPGKLLSAGIIERFRSGRTFLEPDTSEKTLQVLKRVRAGPSCIGCHSRQPGAEGLETGDLLGGMHMQVSYAGLTEKLTQYGHLQVITTLLLVAFVTVMTILLVKVFMGQPLRRLIHSIEAAERGDYLNRVEVSTSDEIGDLAEKLNALLVKLTDIQVSRIDSDMELDIAQRELKLKSQLEEKNRIIEETNRKLTRRLSQLALLIDINSALATSLQTDQIIKSVEEKISQAFGFDGFFALLTQPGGGNPSIQSVLDKQSAELLGREVDPLHGLFTRALRIKKTVLVDDLSNSVLAGSDEELLPGHGSFLGVPLVHKDEILGQLNFFRQEKDAFPEDTVQLLGSVAHQVAMAVSNARLYQEKLDMSVTDELTQLANRRLLNTRLELEWNRAHRFDIPLTLLMVDIDHFKKYNDRNGHLLGDKVLKGVARILESNTRKVDTVARFGGEEFVIILPDQDKATASAVADKLRGAVRNGSFPRTHSQPGGHLTISVGVAGYPDDASEASVLLARSDLALYASKRAGRDRTIAYHENMRSMEEEHRLALAAKQARRRSRRRSKKKKLDLIDPT